MSDITLWYTAEEMRHYLRRKRYSVEIADELCMDYAANLQRAFNKGYEFSRRSSDKDSAPAVAQVSVSVRSWTIEWTQNNGIKRTGHAASDLKLAAILVDIIEGSEPQNITITPNKL